MIHVEQHGPVTAIRMARSLIWRPLHWTAAYWVDGLLIDTGPDCTAPELVRVLERVHVDQIVITHVHEDTIGGLALLKKHYPHAQVFAAPRAIPLLQQPDDLRLHFYRRVLWGLPHPINDVVSLDAVNDCITTPDYRLRVIETPGHTLDHVSLFEPHQRWIFCGDAFIGGEDKAWSPEFNMFGIVSSLRTIASLRPERLFPGSGNVRRTPQPELHQKIGSLIRLCRKVAKLEAVGLTVAEIVVYLFNEEPRLTFWTQGHLSVANLIEACRSYNAIFAPTHAGEWQDEAPQSIDPPQSKRPSTPQDSSGKPNDQSDFVH